MKLPRFIGRLYYRIGASLFDNPRFSLGDPRAVDYLLDGDTSTTGLRVSRQIALTSSTWYRGIELFGNLVAKLPLNLYRTIPNGGGRTIATSHPWSAAMMRKAGPWWTPFELRRFLVVSCKIEGNGYAYIDRDRFELRPLNPRAVTPVIESDKSTGVERLFYVVNAGTPDAVKYQADEVLHVRGLSLDGITGLSVFDLARESLGLGIAARRFQALALKNSSRPGIVLKTAQKLDQQARKALTDGWERMHSGGNIGRTAVLDCGMDAAALGFSAEEIKLIETQKFSIVDVANFIGLPAHLLGDASGDGYNGLEQKNLAMLGHSIDPVLVSHEQEFADKLLTEDEKKSGEVEIAYDRDKLTATDTAAKVAQWRFMTGGHPIATIAEARRAFGLNHEEGTEYIPEPANMTKNGGGDDAEPPPAPPVQKPPAPGQPPAPATPAPGQARNPLADVAEAQLAGSVQAILVSTLGRIARRITNQVKATRAGVASLDPHKLVTDAAAAHGLADVEAAIETVRGIKFGVSIADQIRHEFVRHLAAFDGDIAPACEAFEGKILALGEVR